MVVLDEKRGESFVVRLGDDEVDGGLRIEVHRPTPEGDVFRAVARFMPGMEAIARLRFDALQDDNDVDILFQEFGDEDDRDEYEVITTDELLAGVEPSSEAVEAAAEVPQRGPIVPGLAGRRVGRWAPPSAQPEPEMPPGGKRRLPKAKPPLVIKPNERDLMPLEEYDHFIVSFSGGKDSTACVLHLLEMGVPPGRIELWHQAVDGRPGKDERLWDWPCTEAYCRAFARAFGMRMLFQWREGGYDGELLKEDALSAPVSFETPDGGVVTVQPGKQAEPATRRMFPFPGANLQTRWCSSTLKIEVAARALTNDPRFSRNVNVLFLTGERREESNNRAQYAEVIHHRSEALSYGRRIDQWRSIINWTEEDVWDAMSRFRVRPHPAYYLGWSRVSCLPCIFGGPRQWAAVREIAPDVFSKLRAYEDQFGSEAHARADALEAGWSLPEPPSDLLVRMRHERSRLEASGIEQPDRAVVAAALGVPEADLQIAEKIVQLRKFEGTIRPGGNLDEETAKADEKGGSILVRDPEALELAMAEHYPQDMLLLPEGEEWRMPAGAFRRDSAGPT